MKNVIIVLSLIFLTYSCKESKDSLNGKSNVFSKSFDDGSKYIKQVSEDGFILAEGVLNKDSIKTGKWKFYFKDADTIIVDEYMNIAGRQYLNRSWYLNKKGDTLWSSGHFFSTKFKDTVKVGETATLKILLQKPLFSFNSDFLLLLPKIKGSKLKNDFSNQKEVAYDTIFSLKYDDLNKNKKGPLNHLIFVNFRFSSSGQKTIKGILEELYIPEHDSLDLEIRKMYLIEEIYVLPK